MKKRGAYYNDVDPFSVAWLRELIKKGLIADGEVDDRSITDVQASDLRGFVQCHFYAGIGLWSLAFRLAGIRDDEPGWSMSCPCPPFSVAGKKKFCPECQGGDLIACPRRTGFFICCGCGHAWLADPRHLWPESWRLIRDARPDCPIYGEQVASPDGRVWLASVRASLDLMAYDVWAADLCSAGIGKDHIRQRLGWVAYPDGWFARNRELQSGGKYGLVAQDGSAADGLAVSERRAAERHGHEMAGAARGVRGEAREQRFRPDVGDGSAIDWMDDVNGARHESARSGPEGEARDDTRLRGLERRCEDAQGLEHTSRDGRKQRRTKSGERSAIVRRSDRERLADADSEGSSGRRVQGQGQGQGSGEGFGAARERSEGLRAAGHGVAQGHTDEPGLEGRRIESQEHPDQFSSGPPSVAIPCSDGKWRRVPATAQGEPEPALFPLADARAFRNRVGMLRGSGNAIDPFVWSEFIQAFREGREITLP